MKNLKYFLFIYCMSKRFFMCYICQNPKTFCFTRFKLDAESKMLSHLDPSVNKIN